MCVCVCVCVCMCRCMSAHSAGVECPDMKLKYLMEGSSSRALGNVEYPFIAITLRSTLTRCGNTR